MKKSVKIFAAGLLLLAGLSFSACKFIFGNGGTSGTDEPAVENPDDGKDDEKNDGKEDDAGNTGGQTTPDPVVITYPVNIYKNSTEAKLTWDGTSIAASKFADVTDDIKIVVTYVENSDTASYYKCKLASNGQELYAGTFINATIDLTSSNADNLHGINLTGKPVSTELKFSYNPSSAEWKKIKAGGFKIYGSGFTVTSIDLYKDNIPVYNDTGDSGDSGNTGDSGDGETQTPVTTTTTVFSTPTDAVWSKSTIVVAASAFSGLSSPVKMVFTYVSNADTDYTSCKFMSGSSELYAGTFTGATIDLTSTNADNLHGISLTTAPATEENTFNYTLSDSELTAVKANGFTLIGHGMKINKIELVTTTGSSGSGETGTGTSDAVLSKLTSIQFAAAMKAGWNLGNTFDSAEYGNKNNILKTNGKSYETAWGMPETTKAMIDAVAAKGFTTIRIPVSWHNHITDANYTIDTNWLARVKVVVDWALADNMFVIINIHHDNLTSANMSNTYGYSVNTTASENTTSKAYIKAVWEQVAAYFKDYDEHLIFELLNEPRNRDATNDGFEAPSNLSDINAVIASYEQVALDAVRNAGGLNANRFVMVPYYAAQPWSNEGWTVPTDTATGKLLISTHAYDPYSFAMGDIKNTDFTEADEGSELTNLFTNCLKTRWTSNGYGVVMGEASCTDKNNLSDRLAWFNYYMGEAKKINCSVVLWDNMTTISTGGTDVAERHGYFNRNSLTWYFPTLVEAMVDAYK